MLICSNDVSVFVRKAARNFNAPMCKAAKCTIAEVEEIVEVGELKPDEIHIPNIFVHRIIVGKDHEKRIEVIYLRVKQKYRIHLLVIATNCT